MILDCSCPQPLEELPELPEAAKIGVEIKMFSQANSNLDESALRNQLGQAQLKISSLEDYIRQREQAFQVRAITSKFCYSLKCSRSQLTICLGRGKQHAW